MAGAYSWTISSALLIFAAGPLLAQGDSVSMQELQACRDYEDPAARMACYDNIGKTATPAPTAAPAPASPPVVEEKPAQAPAPAAEPAVPQDFPPSQAVAPAETPAATASDEPYRELTDDVGLPRSEDELQTLRATVVRCGEASNRRFYFYFDNGQVWKYLGRKKLRFLDCDNQATLVEDGFGFSFKLDGDERELRVQRVQ